ncbi:MAG TPA: TIGR03435 family protein, partial [Bryobacteraceae bacterium]|nr:TIGR03435 family protein [Bryobacteraceae bacterium]
NDPRDSNPRLNRLITCQNVTVTQFAGLLQGLAPDYLATSVADATGLDGAWDFTLSFSAPYLLASPSAGESASDPNGAVSLREAVNKQLGLKLEKRLRPVSILVIDHMEEKPTEN